LKTTETDLSSKYIFVKHQMLLT